MSFIRPAIALDVRSFGRGRRWLVPEVKAAAPASDDLKLFATTFLAGFVFVSLFLA